MRKNLCSKQRDQCGKKAGCEKQNNKLGELKEIHSSGTKKNAWEGKNWMGKYGADNEIHLVKDTLRELEFMPRAMGNH